MNNATIALTGLHGPLAKAIVERRAMRAAAEQASWRKINLENTDSSSYVGNNPLRALGYGAALIVADARVILDACDAHPALRDLRATEGDVPEDLEEAVEEVRKDLSGALLSALWDIESVGMIDLLGAAKHLQSRGLIDDADHFAAVLFALVSFGGPNSCSPCGHEVDEDADPEELWDELAAEILENETEEDD